MPRLGFRRITLLCGTMPIMLTHIVLPIVGLYLGHLNEDDWTLSELCTSNVLYGGCFFLAWGNFAAATAYVWLEFQRYMRRQDSRIAAVIGIQCALCCWGIFPFLLLLIGFPISATRPHLFSSPENQRLAWCVHCVGATVMFGCLSLVIFLNVVLVGPMCKTQFAQDAYWSDLIGKGTLCMYPGLIIARINHLATNAAMWGAIFLLFEVAILMAAAILTLMGSWQVMGLLDKEEPVVSFSCLKSILEEKVGRRKHTKTEERDDMDNADDGKDNDHISKREETVQLGSTTRKRLT